MNRQLTQELLPQELWANVRLFNLAGHDPWVVMDTVGMWQLDVPDHEAAFRSDLYDPSDVALFLRNAADYVLRSGPIINDNDTMDGPGQIRWLKPGQLKIQFARRLGRCFGGSHATTPPHRPTSPMGHPRTMMPNTSFQRTLTRGGFGPLNSDR